MELRQLLQNGPLLLDGGMGTLLQGAGLAPGERPERWNLSHPEVVTAFHRAYFDAGSTIVSTNTFGANLRHYAGEELEKVVFAAVANVKKAAKQSTRPGKKYVALDIGPSGMLLKPLGPMDFEEAVTLFAKTVQLGVASGVDCILIETMSDLNEARAALLAAKENSDLPVLVSCAFGQDGKLMTGADARTVATVLSGMGADAVGLNCSFGPEQLWPIAKEFLESTELPVLMKPNAGLPRMENGKTVYDVSPKIFANVLKKAVRGGVAIVGGCCGTTPEYIKALSASVSGLTVKPGKARSRAVLSSAIKTVSVGDVPILVGERINPTGKKKLQAALREGDTDYILQEAIRQTEAGCDVLDVNVGLPDIDEVAILPQIVEAVQGVSILPLQLDTASPEAMEAALRRYNGRALINSVNGKEDSMRAIFPLVKKYGGMVVALTLDEEGIPETAKGRVAVAKKILSVAKEYGITKEQILFDPLAMAVSAGDQAAVVTLETVKALTGQLGVHTILGVSNVSFGLPERSDVNSFFYTLALHNGLSAAILNPFSEEMMRAYRIFLLLSGRDKNCTDYLNFCQTHPKAAPAVSAAPKETAVSDHTGSELQKAVREGRSESASSLTREALKDREPMNIIQEELIPALDDVGRGFAKGTLFLPQLLLSAKAVQAAFSVIRQSVEAGGRGPKRFPIVLATVEGDVHDIGKNIVGLLLDNYGFEVIDLGKDVPPATVLEAAVKYKVPLVGLSALMTTTVPSMEKTIQLLHESVPGIRVVVGGAVLNETYARQIQADYYAADALETVRYALEVEKEMKK